LLRTVVIDAAGVGGRQIKPALPAAGHFPNLQAFLFKGFDLPLSIGHLLPGPQGIDIIPGEDFLLEKRQHPLHSIRIFA